MILFGEKQIRYAVDGYVDHCGRNTHTWDWSAATRLGLTLPHRVTATSNATSA